MEEFKNSTLEKNIQKLKKYLNFEKKISFFKTIKFLQHQNIFFSRSKKKNFSKVLTFSYAIKR
jgi:hypothetical protein